MLPCGQNTWALCDGGGGDGNDDDDSYGRESAIKHGGNTGPATGPRDLYQGRRVARDTVNHPTSDGEPARDIRNRFTIAVHDEFER